MPSCFETPRYSALKARVNALKARLLSMRALVLRCARDKRPELTPAAPSVTRGFNPRVHRLRSNAERTEGMDCRFEAIESGNDGRGAPPKSALADLGSHNLPISGKPEIGKL